MTPPERDKPLTAVEERLAPLIVPVDVIAPVLLIPLVAKDWPNVLVPLKDWLVRLSRATLAVRLGSAIDPVMPPETLKAPVIEVAPSVETPATNAPEVFSEAADSPPELEALPAVNPLVIAAVLPERAPLAVMFPPAVTLLVAARPAKLLI